jgi:hypothetical protein
MVGVRFSSVSLLNYKFIAATRLFPLDSALKRDFYGDRDKNLGKISFFMGAAATALFPINRRLQNL